MIFEGIPGKIFPDISGKVSKKKLQEESPQNFGKNKFMREFENKYLKLL